MELHFEGWDRAKALDSVGGDEKFLSELAGIFCAAYPTLMKSLEESIADRDYFRVADAAHLLGRAAQGLAAIEVTKAALIVEKMARQNEFNDIENALHALQQQGHQLIGALAAFRNLRPGD